MENKIKNIKKSKKVQKFVCFTRKLVGEVIVAALAIAYVSEHINQIPHQAAIVVGVVVIGLILYFANANQVK